jgi:tRNA dimethylallyltransferase
VFGGEIVACDSTAVYRGIDIGTDKLSPDEQRGIPHHLVDVAGPEETYSAARYAADAAAAIRAIHRRRKLLILAGGRDSTTGLRARHVPGPERDEALRPASNVSQTKRGGRAASVAGEGGSRVGSGSSRVIASG